MQDLKIISLGAWCRTAYQIHSFAKRNRIEIVKGPFDWTITPFHALQNCLNPDFDPKTILQLDNLISSYARSGMCGKTGLIFHHAIHKRFSKEINFPMPGEKIIKTKESIRLINNAKGRFIHTFNNLKTFQNYSGKTLFVRWRRSGHPDRQYPIAFDGEDTNALLLTIKNFLGHERFYVLSVESQLINDRRKPILNPIINFQTDKQSIFCSIKERKGWNGNQTTSFRGDEHSWDFALKRTITYLQQAKG